MLLWIERGLRCYLLLTQHFPAKSDNGQWRQSNILWHLGTFNPVLMNRIHETNTPGFCVPLNTLSKCHLNLIDRVYLQMGDKRCWKNMCKVNSSHHNSETDAEATSAFVISVPQMGMRTWPGRFKPKASCHLLNISASPGRLTMVPASVVPWLLNWNTLTSILVPCFEEGQPGRGMKACGCSLTSPRLGRAPVLLYISTSESPSHGFTNTNLLLGAVLVPFVCLVTGENSFRKSSPAGRRTECCPSSLPPTKLTLRCLKRGDYLLFSP